MGMEEPYHYRNKAQFPVGKNKDGKIITGFYAGRTHSIIDNRECILGVKQNKEVLDRVIGHMENIMYSLTMRLREKVLYVIL